MLYIILGYLVNNCKAVSCSKIVQLSNCPIVRGQHDINYNTVSLQQ